MQYDIDPGRHAKIFGGNAEDRETGRSRRCRSCGGWHRLDRPWPHNCRAPAPPPQRLAAPQLAPKFEPFKTGLLDSAEVIGSRNDKREYMRRNDLVEYDNGVGRRNEWVEDHETGREIVETIKRFHETDSENLPPDLRAQRMDAAGSLDEGTEISATDIKVIE